MTTTITPFVVNFGEGVDLLEGKNMICVDEDTSIGIPRKYIFMGQIAGQSLLSSWPRLGLSGKEALLPPSYYGSLDKRPLLDGIFWAGEPDPASIAEFLRHYLLRVLCNQCPAFTHGDFQRKNIMLQVKETMPATIALIGLYPAYWEYCLASCALRFDDDW
ncbi:hypothetical protein V8F44DRAFT_667167 [Aspergillus fumigatus]